MTKTRTKTMTIQGTLKCRAVNYQNNKILVFLRENELTETEMTWPREFETKSEVELLSLIDQIML
jgi:hypothetical protein